MKLWPATGHDINRCVAVDRIRRYQRSRTGRDPWAPHCRAKRWWVWEPATAKRWWVGSRRRRSGGGLGAGDGEAVVGWEPATLRFGRRGRNVAGGSLSASNALDRIDRGIAYFCLCVKEWRQVQEATGADGYALLSGPRVLIESWHGDAKKVLQTHSVLARAWNEAYSECVGIGV